MPMTGMIRRMAMMTTVKRWQNISGKPLGGYPVFNGTGANVLGLSAILPRFGAVICTNHAHINNDESIAPQYVAGIKLLVVDSDDGKLDPQKIHQFIRPSEHHPNY